MRNFEAVSPLKPGVCKGNPMYALQETPTVISATICTDVGYLFKVPYYERLNVFFVYFKGLSKLNVF